MDIRIEQSCPQCGALLDLAETDRLLTCSYCGVRCLLSSQDVFRYTLPPAVEPEPDTPFLMVPYFHFKGTIYLVSKSGIEYRVVDTTQLGIEVKGLPPAMGARSRAMKLKRVYKGMAAKYTLRSLDPQDVLIKASQVSGLHPGTVGAMYHRAFIGETISIIYLPLVRKKGEFIDAVTGAKVRLRSSGSENGPDYTFSDFRQEWEVGYRAALCPHCGWNLEGESDAVVMHCGNCDRAWSMEEGGLKAVDFFLEKKKQAGFMLPFWRISGMLPALGITTFADFLQRTNRHITAPATGHEQPVAFVIPAFRLRPKLFLQSARNATLTQHKLRWSRTKLQLKTAFPVTLPQKEAAQAVKVILAASAVSPRQVYPHLPGARLENRRASLLYLSFSDRGHDWVNDRCGIAIPKRILAFGRAM